MSGPTVHFGSFDAELAWRPSRLARLPAGPMPESNRATRGMDELLAAGCASGDLLLTSEPVSNALVDVLAAAGISPVVRAVPGPASSTVEQRLAHVDPAALPGVNGWAASVYAVVPGTAAAVAALGLRASLPGVPDVARVNSKTWSNELVVRLGLPGAAVLATSPSAVRQYATLISERGVVLKDPYGVSGRGALRVGSGRVLDTVVRHLEW
jgi:hypothetical protein